MEVDGKNSSQSAWLMVQTGLSLSVTGAMAVGLRSLPEVAHE
jgi:hypothetical protein